MIILKAILIILWLFIIPELVGLIFTKFLKEEKNNIVIAFVIGYLATFAICQLLSVPLIIMHAEFVTLSYTYTFVMIILSIISLIINRKGFKEIVLKSYNYIKQMPKILSLSLIILIKYAHIDEED